MTRKCCFLYKNILHSEGILFLSILQVLKVKCHGDVLTPDPYSRSAKCYLPWRQLHDEGQVCSERYVASSHGNRWQLLFPVVVGSYSVNTERKGSTIVGVHPRNPSLPGGMRSAHCNRPQRKSRSGPLDFCSRTDVTKFINFFGG